MSRPVKFLLFATLVGGLALVPIAYTRGQQDQQDQQDKQSARQIAKAKQKKEKDLYNELDSQYKKWLNEDVIYIISSEERSAFIHLSTNEEREQFIEQFWQRRNPDPDSPENTFKEEHYRRIAYANEHYASGIPGWKTDRGRLYIMWGPPDEVDSHPSGGSYQRPSEEGGGETTTYPFEDWRWRFLEGIGENVIVEFVDPTMSGEYRLTMDPSEKDALTYIPNAGLTQLEELGISNKTARFNNTDGTHMGQPFGGQPENYNEFSRLELYNKIQQAPAVKYKDLEAVVTNRLVRDQVKFQYRTDFLRITSDTVLVPITVQIPVRQLSFQEKDGVDSATLNLFARITTLSGRIVQTFEDPLRVDFPVSLLQQSLAGYRIYQKAVPLTPNRYKLDIVIKDVNSGNVGVVSTALPVPRFQEDQLSVSSLILADEIHRVSIKDIGVGQFVLGDIKVRPKMDATFTPSDKMGVFLQIYNLKVDDKTHKPDPSVQYRIFKAEGPNTGSSDPVVKLDLAQNRMPEHGEQMTLESMITLGSLEPGKYRLEVVVTDNLAKQTITPKADFIVKPAPVKSTQGR